jgi:hypothetical protein
MTSIEYKKGLPIGYESFLIERYNSYITTCRYIEIHYPAHDIYYMLVYDNGNLVDLLVFGNRKSDAICFNALVSINSAVLEECLRKVFEVYPKIRQIKIDASYTEYKLEKSILVFKSDDQILFLPATVDEYLSELGAKTRKHLKARKANLEKEFEQVSFVTKIGGEIEESSIEKIVQFSRARVKQKGRNFGIDKTYTDNLYRYSRHYGCVVYLELDGVMVAGCISTIINKEIFVHVIAYDDNFSKYNVGEVCVFDLIQTSINNGLVKFHFLWGFNELKRRLQARQNLLFSYMVYRNYSFKYFSTKLKVILFEFMYRFKDTGMFKPLKTSLSTLRQRMKT